MWPQLVRWSYEPALMTYLRFGMHRGERFASPMSTWAAGAGSGCATKARAYCQQSGTEAPTAGRMLPPGL